MNRKFRYYWLDHRILFLAGYLFYFVTPYFVGHFRMFEGYPGISLFQGFFEEIPSSKLNAYLLITLFWLPFFYAGHLTFSLLFPGRRPLSLFPATLTSRSVSYIGILLTGVLILFAYLGRNSLFGGYGSYDISARGKMSTLLIVFDFFLLYQLLSRQVISLWLVTGTLLTALLLLSMGGRLYVIQTFLLYLIFKTSFASKRWTKWQITGFVGMAFLTGSLFGIWRMGSGFNWSRAAYSFFAEPAFTWFSTSTFLIVNPIPVVNFPWNFITSFLNLIPNTIVSLKPFIVSAKEMGYPYLNPLGADSMWTTYIINFGWAGSAFFIFAIGFIMNLLRKLSENRRFWAVYYILMCSMLPFQFFRDGFYIVNKQLFFNFLIFPGLLLLVLRTVLYLSYTYKPTYRMNKKDGTGEPAAV